MLSISSFHCQQTRDGTSKQLQSLQAQLKALQAEPTREVLQQTVPAPEEERNPEPELINNLQLDKTQG